MNEEKFREAVLESDIPVMVHFYAPWCGPCHSMEPIIEELALEYKGKIKFVSLDTSKNPQAAAQYYVRAVPTYIVFVGGKPQEKQVGTASKGSFKGWLNKWV